MTWNLGQTKKSLKKLTQNLNEKQKKEPYWTYSVSLSEDLVAESRGLTPSQWRKEDEGDRAMMISTYRSKRKMSNYETHYHSRD